MKTSLIIDTREYGFFSGCLQILDNLKYCELNNIKPILRLGEKFKYKEDVSNWNNFFENINDGIIEGEGIEITKATPNCNFFLENYLMRSPRSQDYHLKIWDLLRANAPELEIYAHRLEISEMIKKYMVPIQPIKDSVNNFLLNNFLNNEIVKIGIDGLYEVTNKVLGVHVRGTDYGFYDINHYVGWINNILKHHEYERIYIASDNSEAINMLQNAFPNICCSYKTNLRSTTFKSAWMAEILEKKDMVQHGRDVLTESILLSKCHRLICINSNVAGMAAYRNPNLIVHLTHDQFGGG